MDMQSVTSSNLDAIGYDKATKTLQVQFKNGSVYQYEGVSPGTHHALLNAISIGSFFNSHIKDSYGFTKL